MEILPIVFAVVLVILTIVVSVVGIQVILVLNEVRKTLRRANTVIDSVESKVNSVISPFQNFGGVAAGVSTGLKVFESFVNWLHRDQDKKK